MTRFLRFIIPAAIITALLIPLFASAAVGVGFGGRVLSVIPCTSPAGPALQVTIVPLSLTSQVSYIYVFGLPPVGTLTYRSGPPTHIGQSIIGVADIPFGCVVGVAGIFSLPIPLYGQRMQMIGTSIL